MGKTSPSLKRNTIANFAGLGYTTTIGIAIFPLYLQYLGAEAFGLVGFFTMLQAWMQLLDMGMSPLLSRQVARARGNNNVDFYEVKKLLRSLELIVFTLSLCVVYSIFIGSDWIANNWLKNSSLVLTDVEICIVVMGFIIGFRFFSSLYRSGIRGLEYQVSLNVANIILITLKLVGALLLLQYVTQNVVSFFLYQLLIGMIELIVLVVMFYRYMPATDNAGFGFFWKTLKPTLPFAGGIAYTAVIWVLLTQLDKLILSHVLPLAEYGYFALVAIVSAGIIQISAPISQAILPRMTFLLSQGKEKEMLALYRKSTQFMTVLIFPLTGMVALFSMELLYAWTGDKRAAEWAAPILFWFALGNGVLAISAFQYYLQFAHGKLRLHVIYNTISACIQIPLIIYVAFEYGALGVALLWFILRLSLFFFWTPFVHHKFAPGIHWSWLLKDVAPALVSTSLVLWLIDQVSINFDELNRIQALLVLICLGLFTVVMNLLVSSASRELIYTKIKIMKAKLKLD